MAKIKSSFFCQSCGYESPKWIGKCPSCTSWNRMVEEVISKEDKNGSWIATSSKEKRVNKPVAVKDIQHENTVRIITHDAELNRVLGGGVVLGSLVLIGGEPGIGKSTLMLQVALNIKNQKVLYVSGEESPGQIKMRADRIGVDNDECLILSETSTQNIFTQLEEIQPQIVVIDSIQTLHSQLVDSVAGSISQVKECTAELMKFAKETNTPVFLIGHINKDSNIAGPKVLEHMVDTVLQFEGDRHLSYRILRTIKNRFSSTAELGIYEMLQGGLREVSNPSEILITQREEATAGVTIAASQEGNRPLLVETQTLVSTSAYGTPQRVCTGFDQKRLNMLLAVVEKRCGFRLSSQDVFLNMAGGIKVDDPAIDLSICASLVSSFEEIGVSDKICFAGEVGLGGEIRAVNHIENRIAEAEKLGFEAIYISKYNKIEQKEHRIRIVFLTKLSDLFQSLFG